jgi:hypothetical protein
MPMPTDQKKGLTDAPTPPQGRTPQHEQTRGDKPSAPKTAPKTVTDHEHGSTGKPPASATQGRDARPKSG